MPLHERFLIQSYKLGYWSLNYSKILILEQWTQKECVDMKSRLNLQLIETQC